MSRLVTGLATAIAVVAVLACASQRDDGLSTSADLAENDGGLVMHPDAHTDPVIRGLEREAMLLAKTTGCSAPGQCAAAPVGSRPCGGPRYYLAYCPLTTDADALFAKLAQIRAAEEEYNRRHQLVSTCEFRMPPELELGNGACRAKSRFP